MDVLAVRAAVRSAAERARSGAGPSLVVAECFRFEGHFSADQMAYRDKAEADPWKARDPIASFRARLLAEGVAAADDLDAIERRCDDEILAALEWAKASPFPDPASVTDDLDD
jgi:TPP-dependent pyruvate/acetoin dehydrogenase alpha subunit